MKYIFMLLLFGLIACNSAESPSETDQIDTTNTDLPMTDIDSIEENGIPSEIYANERFREVTVEKQGENSYTIRGQAQVFEANINWVVEDGHEELLSGFQTTSAGAPEWGNFEFTVEVKKVRENSTLNLILFEENAEDGGRRYELPVILQ
jgi:hypothetical protein